MSDTGGRQVQTKNGIIVSRHTHLLLTFCQSVLIYSGNPFPKCLTCFESSGL